MDVKHQGHWSCYADELTRSDDGPEYLFAAILGQEGAGTEFEMDDGQFDRLFADGDVFAFGNLDVGVMPLGKRPPPARPM